MTKIKNDKVEKTSTNDLILEQLEKLNKEVKEIKSDNESYLGFLNEYIKSDKFLLVIIIVLLLYHIVVGG